VLISWSRAQCPTAENDGGRPFLKATSPPQGSENFPNTHLGIGSGAFFVAIEAFGCQPRVTNLFPDIKVSFADFQYPAISRRDPPRFIGFLVVLEPLRIAPSPYQRCIDREN